jgi:hypothetical protein
MKVRYEDINCRHSNCNKIIKISTKELKRIQEIESKPKIRDCMNRVSYKDMVSEGWVPIVAGKVCVASDKMYCSKCWNMMVKGWEEFFDKEGKVQ